MPQLIAMIIVVVGAMIYMFQTFGGTGDKIEGVAQKTSIITEINNIKSGVKLAAKSGDIAKDAVLKTLAAAGYFDEQINTQVNDTVNTAHTNDYYAISFGGTVNDTNPAMTLSLVDNVKGQIPGIYVKFGGSLTSNAGFLEAQIATDLQDVASIDRTAKTAKSVALKTSGTTLDKRTPADNAEGGTKDDGMFIIYFKDFSSTEVVQ